MCTRCAVLRRVRQIVRGRRARRPRLSCMFVTRLHLSIPPQRDFPVNSPFRRSLVSAGPRASLGLFCAVSPWRDARRSRPPSAAMASEEPPAPSAEAKPAAVDSKLLFNHEAMLAQCALSHPIPLTSHWS